ncbi:nitric oxide response protein [Sulfurisphaera ohwakuensis]|uniref:nitric oxide response protein n=1 Tax=Sulfurisphaera ohwakuensis TaxID=69656 RepID=UPI0036F339FC
MKLPLLLMISGIILLLFGGIPAVFEFMNMQGFFIDPTSSLFPAHWFIMIYGFFGSLIGNEIFVALSIEWSGKTADNRLIASYLVFTILGIISFFYNQQLGFIFILIAMNILLYYSQEYLGKSRIGINPTVYNWLLFYSLMITIVIISVQIGLGYAIPYLNLIFPTSMIFAVMTRDIGLVTRIKISSSRKWENILAFILLVVGMGFRESVLMLLAWVLSFHASGLYRPKGRRYPILHLTTAWIYLLIGSIFISNYDVFIHSITVGFLFNTVFGVDVVLMDLFVNAFQKRVSVKPSYIPFFLLNIGLIMRLLYDFGFTTPIFILASPLQGLGILSFFILTLRQVLIK